MNAITLTVNGSRTSALVEPRTHLADFLREQLSLTGTHLGCEQGVCGACTVLVDGEPTRSCIAYAVACDGADIRTIEGFDGDPVMGELREAFSVHHALQCGYCTPGMLISSRDIVLRLGEMDAKTIREGLAGNLCRCTGYVGIVRAVEAVSAGKQPARSVKVADLVAMEAQPHPEAPAQQASKEGSSSSPALLRGSAVGRAPQDEVALGVSDVEGLARRVGMAERPSDGPGWTEMTQVVRVQAPPGAVWAALKDVSRVASCLPGASIDSFDGTNVRGSLAVKFGPIRASFSGEGVVAFEDGTSSGLIEGGGRDSRTGSQVRGEIRFGVRDAGGDATEIDVLLRYRITGALAQFARSSIVQNFVGHLAGVFAGNLASMTAGGSGTPPSAAQAAELNAFGLMLALARSWFERSWLSRLLRR